VSNKTDKLNLKNTSGQISASGDKQRNLTFSVNGSVSKSVITMGNDFILTKSKLMSLTDGRSCIKITVMR
jgi:hypothetical protein